MARTSLKARGLRFSPRAAGPISGDGRIATPLHPVAESLEPRELLSAYYVATTGADASPGSLVAPFRSIQKAASSARPGDVVYVRAGTYRETVRPPRSGVAGAPITFQPYNNEPVTISGADVLSGWSNYKGSVYKARQSWDLGFGANQVFVDGRMMTEARWPNTTLDVSHPAMATIDAATAVTDPATLLSTASVSDAALTQPAGYWNGATVHFAPAQEWAAQTGTVTSSATGRLAFTYKQVGVQAPARNNPYYLTGKFQALDAAGEWFRDPTDGQLYLRTPASDSPVKHVVEAKRRQYAFDLRDRDYVNVTGFSLFASTIYTNANSSCLRLSKLNAKYLSHYTTMESGWNVPNDSGIYVNGSHNSISDSVVAYSAGDGIMLLGKDNRATNNVVHDVDYSGGDAAGIRTWGSGHVVTGNTVYNTGRSGIKVSGTTAVKVSYNEVHDAMLQTADGGGIYTFGMDGTGSEICYNRIYNVTSGGWGAAGIFLDNNSIHWVVHHNVVWDTNHALKMNYGAKGNRVFNNTLAGTDTSLATSSNADFTGTVIQNNIFTKTTRVGLNATLSKNIYSGTDARFVDPGNGNFQLRSDSPALNKGAVIAPYTNGYSGRAPDLGAIEYGKAAFAAGADLRVPTPAPSPTPDTVPVTPPSPAIRSARTTIAAESFDKQAGVAAIGGGITSLDAGDWAKYADVDFGAGVGRFTARVAVPASAAGGQIEIRSGGTTGTLLGVLILAATGTPGVFATQGVVLSETVTGVHSLYLVSRGAAVGAVIDAFSFA
jgi:hypothetical protein